MLAILIFSRTTFAEPPAASGASAGATTAPAKAAQALVGRELIQPLAAKERTRSKFSRASLPAQARRVRILDEHKDAHGSTFVRFAVDAHHGFDAPEDGDESRWQLATITGCAYLDSSQVFVKRGNEYRPAAFLLGKNLKAAAETTCQPAQDQLAHKD